MTRRPWLLAAFCLAYFPVLSAAQENVYKKGLKSTVWILQEVGRKGTSISFRTGSGAVIDAQKRLVLTNYHVVGDLKEATVLFPIVDTKGTLVAERDRYMDLYKSGGGIKGKVLFAEPSKDLAVIELVSLPKGGVPAIRLAKDSPSPGDRVHSIGNPGISAGAFNYTDGSVKTVAHRDIRARRPPEPELTLSAKMIETSSSTNKGDSGGPLLNDKCELVGVTQGLVTGGEDTRPISLFIDVTEVKGVLTKHNIRLSAGSGTAVAADTPSAGKPEKPEKPADAPAVAAEKPPADPAKEKRKAEETAASRLSGAKLFLNSNKKEAKKQLTDIVEQFPGTEAAAEAKKLLDTLK